MTVVESCITAEQSMVPAATHSGGARLREGVESLHAVGTVFAAMTPGVEVIDPAATRAALARAIAQAPQRRGRHGNIPL